MIIFINDDSNYSSGSSGTGTFISNKTVISCAHIVHQRKFDKNDKLTHTGIINNLTFFPGANSYPNITNFYSNFGKFLATHTFVPISFVISNRSTEYDWSISLTDILSEGIYTHSYMGLNNFTSVGTELNPSSLIVESVGYPGVIDKINEDLRHTMWTSYPLLNSVFGDFYMVIIMD